MKKLSIFALALFCIVDLTSCESTSFAPPPVTAEMAKAGPRQHVDLATLRQGRTLFVSRCIECHTLPAVARYPADAWPVLVDEMADRASLKPVQRNAIVAYLQAARSE
jgi:mono/diheme cytochrome c family protein